MLTKVAGGGENRYVILKKWYFEMETRNNRALLLSGAVLFSVMGGVNVANAAEQLKINEEKPNLVINNENEVKAPRTERGSALIEKKVYNNILGEGVDIEIVDRSRVKVVPFDHQTSNEEGKERFVSNVLERFSKLSEDKRQRKVEKANELIRDAFDGTSKEIEDNSNKVEEKKSDGGLANNSGNEDNKKGVEIVLEEDKKIEHDESNLGGGDINNINNEDNNVISQEIIDKVNATENPKQSGDEEEAIVLDVEGGDAEKEQDDHEIEEEKLDADSPADHENENGEKDLNEGIGTNTVPDGDNANRIETIGLEYGYGTENQCENKVEKNGEFASSEKDDVKNRQKFDAKEETMAPEHGTQEAQPRTWYGKVYTSVKHGLSYAWNGIKSGWSKVKSFFKWK